MSVKQNSSDGFLSRWSARKRERDDEPASTVQDPLQGDEPASVKVGDQTLEGYRDSTTDESHARPAMQLTEPVVADAEHEQPLLSDEDMPTIESLNAQSDVSAFFNKGVSAALRRAALRHVFQQPEYNLRDGLNDYDGDYTVFEPLGDTVTADMKFHAARKERERLEAERLEAERLEAERLEAERLESEDAQHAAARHQENEHPDESSESSGQTIVDNESMAGSDSEDKLLVSTEAEIAKDEQIT